jgi:hypothetical protein
MNTKNRIVPVIRVASGERGWRSANTEERDKEAPVTKPESREVMRFVMPELICILN